MAQAREPWKPMPTGFYLYVPDTDAVYQAAQAAFEVPLIPVILGDAQPQLPGLAFGVPGHPGKLSKMRVSGRRCGGGRP